MGEELQLNGADVVELLKTKSDATSATVVVSTEICNSTSRQFRSGTGFALNQRALALPKLTPQTIAPTANDEFGGNGRTPLSSGNFKGERFARPWFAKAN